MNFYKCDFFTGLQCTHFASFTNKNVSYQLVIQRRLLFAFSHYNQHFWFGCAIFILPFYWMGYVISKRSLPTKMKYFHRLVGILRVYLDSGDDFQWGLGRQMDRAKQLHLDHFRSHGNFIDSKKTTRKMPDKQVFYF